jgi:hypothetical protein
VNRSLCTCPIPHRGYATEVRPRGDQFCTCGGYIEPSWASTDKAMDEFYDRLEILPTNREPVPGTDPPVYVPTPAFKLFRMDALAREFAGRRKFGLRFLGRNNPKDGQEEATDGANYAAFEIIKQENRHGNDAATDLLLRAAQKFFEAYELLAEARRALKDSP